MQGRFRHYRLHDKDEKILPRGGVTVYYEEVEPKYFRVGIAYCSPLDNFSREIGRAISMGRFKNGRAIQSEMSWEEFNAWIVSFIKVRFESIQARHGRWSAYWEMG